ncbi:MAG: Calx-beta domain-containing protein, partial [Litorilinea sp.]
MLNRTVYPVRVLCCALAFAACAFLTQPLWAVGATAFAQTTIEVTSDCTQKEAITIANEGGDPDDTYGCGAISADTEYIIEFRPFEIAYGSGTDETYGYTVFPTITSNVTINGNGARIVRPSAWGCPTATANRNYRFFHVASGSLTLNDLTLDGGCTVGNGIGSQGGAILVTGGELAINNSQFLNNRAISEDTDEWYTGAGGAIAFRSDAPLSIELSYFAYNSTEGIDTSGTSSYKSLGGALFITAPTGTGDGVTITDTDFYSNSTHANGARQSSRGGAIAKFQGSHTVTIQGSSFVENQAISPDLFRNGLGGALYIYDSGQITISHSTVFSANVASNAGSSSAGGRGGAIALFGNNAESLHVIDTIFHNNRAQQGPDAELGYGGAVHNDSEAPVSITQSCIVGNNQNAEPITTLDYAAAISVNDHVTLVATNNWWGSADGPERLVNETSTATVGSGDRVSRSVDFANWDTAPPALCADLYEETSLDLSKSVSPTGEVTAGDTLTYTLRYTNTGSTATFHTLLTDTLPASLENPVISSNPTVTNTGTLPTLLWDLGVLVPNASGIITVQAQVAESVGASAILLNVAQVGAGNAPQTNASASNLVALPLVNLDETVISIDEDDGPVTISISLSAAMPSDSVTVTLATANGSALAGTDYTAVNQAVIFAPNETQKTVNIPITNNSIADGPRSFTVSISNPEKAVLGDDTTAT